MLAIRTAAGPQKLWARRKVSLDTRTVSCDTVGMAYKDDLHLPQFPSDLSCQAAGIDLATLKNWSSRKPHAVFLGDNEREQIGDRTFLRLSLRRVLQLAITAELVQLNISPRDAAWYASVFTDGEDGNYNRKAGELFRKNFTLLIVQNAQAEVINVGADDSWRLIPRLTLTPLARPTAMVVVNLNEIDSRVRSVLGVPVLVRKGVV